ncbi:Gfo/Idh/MocA family protein [Bacillus rubiinfantis]|uniref:Gfo/Idh/MocA family protein n=1 Tax=Bacillus rubiinfantis TaxID=1499680 RepID=UPI0011DDE695
MSFATVGTGWITESFIQAALESKQMQLAAIYSRSIEKAQALADTYNAPHYFTNIEEMAQSTGIDVVYIASPNALHFQQVLPFLKNNKHVICEKPIFSTFAEWEEAHRVAEENGVYLFEAIRNIHTPNFQILKDKLSLAGTLRSAMLSYIQYSSRYDKFLNGETPNVFSAEFSGGALVDLGVYPLYIAVGLFGAPKKVTYHPVLLRSGIDGSGTLVLEYDGFVCTILCSKIAHSSQQSEIHGENGTFVLSEAAPISDVTFIDSHTKKAQVLSLEQAVKDMVYECVTFARIIETGNNREYETLKNWSRTVLTITEEARRQNGIVFGAEK